MEFIRKTLAQVGQHLSGLTISQRLAIGLCVVLMAVAVVWLLQWSARPEMVPVVFEGFSPDQLLVAEAELRAMGTSYKKEGDKILVRLADRDRVLARLGERQVLPADTSLTIEKLIEQESPFRSQAESERIWSYAKEQRLSRLLSRFRGIQRATVVMDKPTRRGIGREAAKPTASVLVWTKPGYELKQENVDALAGFVARAQAGLDLTNVGIIDARTGRQYRVRNAESPVASDLLELAKKTEDHYAQKIQDQLRSIPGVLVNVFAELDPSARRTENRLLAEPLDVEMEITKQTETRHMGGGEAGVVPNVGQGLAGGGGGTVSEQKTEIIKSVPGGEQVEVTETGRGVVKSLRAVVSVPRSYLVAIFQQQPGNEDQQPSDQELRSTGQFEEIRKQVMPLIRAEDAALVQVSMYYDVGVGWAFAEGGVGEAETAALGLAKRYGGQVGLGVLAVLSLVMMLFLAKRGPDRMVGGRLADAGELGGLGEQAESGPMSVLSGDAPPVGDAQLSSGVLEGQELDEQTIRTQEMAEQLERLSEEDPGNVASLVKRWLEKDHR